MPRFRVMVSLAMGGASVRPGELVELEYPADWSEQIAAGYLVPYDWAAHDAAAATLTPANETLHADTALDFYERGILPAELDVDDPDADLD